LERSWDKKISPFRFRCQSSVNKHACRFQAIGYIHLEAVAENQPLGFDERNPASIIENRMSESIEEFAFHLTAFIQNPGGTWDFDKMALRLFGIQFAHVPAYQRLCLSRGVTPQTAESWTQIPFFPASAFKDFEVTSLAPHDRKCWFLSSGTTAQRASRHFHNELSLRIYELSLSHGFQHRVFPRFNALNPDKAGLRMVSLSPPRTQAPHSSLVFMLDAFRPFFEETAFLGNAAPSGSWELDYATTFQHLSKIGDRPILLAGTAFLYALLFEWMELNATSLKLPTGSIVLETGGYKGRVRHISKSALYEKIEKFLGVESPSIVCEYGMCELSSQAYDEPSGLSLPRRKTMADGRVRKNQSAGPDEPALESTRLFHFPPWARAQIISPETGREVGLGEMGLIRVMDLANIHSVMAIQTEDLGVRRENGFNLLGRNTDAAPKGCSLMAADGMEK
jgi:hypothetical protein